MLFIALLLCPVLTWSQLNDFFSAARKGDVLKIEDLLNKGVKIDDIDKNGRTALIEATVNHQIQVAKFLLEKGAKTNIVDKDGFSALRAATASGDSSIAKNLIVAGADVNLKHPTGITVLMVAAATGHINVLQLLLSVGADINAKNEDGYDALSMASEIIYVLGNFGQGKKKVGLPKFPEVIAALLKAGASPDNALTFIDPNYIENAPNSFTILPVKDLRTTKEKEKSSALAEKFGNDLAKEFKSRKYKIQNPKEAQKKLGISDTVTSIDRSFACHELGTDGIMQVELLSSSKLNIGVAAFSGMEVSLSLVDCKSGKIIWKHFYIYTEERGFILAAFMSGSRHIAFGIALNFPLCPRSKED